MMNTTQLVVRTDKNAIEWLESKGFLNFHDLPNDYGFSVFTVDLSYKKIFGTNVTCMAAACSCGKKPIILTFEQLKDKLSG